MVALAFATGIFLICLGLSFILGESLESRGMLLIALIGVASMLAYTGLALQQLLALFK